MPPHPHTLHHRDIVIVGQQPWDTPIGSNCKNLALEFAKTNRVLYVNSPLDRITLLKQKDNPIIQKRIALRQQHGNYIEKIGDNLWNLFPDAIIESINWLKVHALFNILNKRNNSLFAASIQDGMRQLGFKDIILFNDNDIFRCFYLKDMLKPAVSIYYSRDYMIGVDYWKFHGEKLEPQLIKKSDICVANSVYLANYCKQYNPRSHYVGQGCDLSMFTAANTREIPTDLAAIPKPIAGYVGALQSIRLDIPLLETVVKNLPDWNIVLVGPEDETFAQSALHLLPNIHFLGAKKPQELPAYIAGFDVCINPQLVNLITIGNYPRKIDEYLALGKPVVATQTEAMSIFAQHTYLGANAAEYTALIPKALNENTPQKQQDRTAFAATHTWEDNINQIYAAIYSFTNGN
ncbi:MAG: glycosyltransferase family 1 protein [Chitinophagia bacterium]|nr:glycosyltransferase family 1 protein [Chitinophagia bacterium]